MWRRPLVEGALPSGYRVDRLLKDRQARHRLSGHRRTFPPLSLRQSHSYQSLSLHSQALTVPHSRNLPRRPRLRRRPCGISKRCRNAHSSWKSCAKTAGIFRRRRKSSILRAAIFTRSSSSTISSRTSKAGRASARVFFDIPTQHGRQPLFVSPLRGFAHSRPFDSPWARLDDFESSPGESRACSERASKRRVEERKVRTPEGSAPGNSRSGQPEGQWHRKYTALSEAARPSRRVRVKRCGKSAPRAQKCVWQAKPRTEQDQIGKRLNAGAQAPADE